MKKLALLSIVLPAIMIMTGCNSAKDPSGWSTGQTERWFEKHEWLKGWNVKPDASINKKEFAHYYFKNRERWDKAFAFLRSNDLKSMEPKRYDIDGDNLYATISEAMTKNEEDAKFEAHRKYIDIQYVISGSEQMSITPMSDKNEEVAAYDPAKDIEFMTVKGTSSYVATPDKFFIFFPSDIHRPGVKVGENKQVRKIVIKVKVD